MITINVSKAIGAILPRPFSINFQERFRSAFGAASGIAFSAIISMWLAKTLHLTPWLVAPVGASAVLVYATPSSPLAQPWRVIGGNTVSAIMGIVACNLITDPVLSAGIAVGLAIGGMFATRTLHPPGGAMALLVVLTHTQNPLFAVFPAFINSGILVGFGLLYNNLTAHPYPHRLVRTNQPVSGLHRVTDADFAQALAEHNEVVDIDIDELNRIVRAGELIAYRRMAQTMICEDLMTPNPLTVTLVTPLKRALLIMQHNDIKALPVVDRSGRVLGFLARDAPLVQVQAAALESLSTAETLLASLPLIASQSKPLVRHAMSSSFASVRPDESAVTLMAKFFEGDHRHVLVMNDRNRVLGIISASDLMQTLYHKAA